jgi:hypothetical protein
MRMTQEEGKQQSEQPLLLSLRSMYKTVQQNFLILEKLKQNMQPAAAK